MKLTTILTVLVAIFLISCGNSQLDTLKQSVNSRMHFVIDSHSGQGNGDATEISGLNTKIDSLTALRDDIEKINKLSDYKENTFLEYSSVVSSLKGAIDLRKAISKDLADRSGDVSDTEPSPFKAQMMESMKDMPARFTPPIIKTN